MINQQSQDLFEDVPFPSWISDNISNIAMDSVFSYESGRNSDINILSSINVSQRQKNPILKGLAQIRNQSSQSNQINSSQQNQGTQRQGNRSLKSKQQRRCHIAKKYRQRKKEYYKSLQEQNRLLKYKVDELTFRIQQMEKQLNKLRHNPFQNTQNFHTTKSKCLKQIQQVIQTNQPNQKLLLEAAEKWKKVIAFDNKQKVDYLNYFMSELLQNLINDRGFYFIDCLLNKRGMHRSKDTQLRKIDLQVFNILKVEEQQMKEVFLQRPKYFLEQEARRLKQLWKKLYKDYLSILNQGMKMQRIVEPMKKQLLSMVKIQNYFRLQLFFEKNKYRSDIRYIRNSWFRQMEQEQRTIQ